MRQRQCGVTWLLIGWVSTSSSASTASFMRTTRRPFLSPHVMALRGGAADEAQHEEEVNEESSDVPNEESAILTTEESLLEKSIESDDTEETPNVVVNDDESRMTLVLEQAQELRQAGKDLHDQGDWEQAAIKFQKASLLLEEWEGEPLLEEYYATCRLHEALCFLKQHDYTKCIEACTKVLEREPPAAIRARALHRRSRAKLGLGGLEEDALQDARSAAFLGDRKAVALYGKLMRQDSSSWSDAPSLQDMFPGGNPFMAAAASGDSTSISSGLLESLLNKSTSNGNAANNAMSMLMNGNNSKGGGGAGLAKSVLSSLSKQVENESTQENICRYLQNANEAQFQQLAAMAGVPLSQGHASRLVSLCHSITPKKIGKCVKTTKRLWYGITLIRKMSQILSKYRYILVLWLLIAWIKSALYRPIPINKRTAARLAMKHALINQVAM